MKLPMKSPRGYDYDLLEALRRNPTLIQAGVDICGQAAEEIERREAEIARLRGWLRKMDDTPGSNYEELWGMISSALDGDPVDPAEGARDELPDRGRIIARETVRYVSETVEYPDAAEAVLDIEIRETDRWKGWKVHDRSHEGDQVIVEFRREYP